MLSQKYIKSFLKESENEVFKFTAKKILIHENEFNKSFLEWGNEELEFYLKSFHSKSIVSVNLNLMGLRKFANYICKNELIPCPKYKFEIGKLYEMVDYNKLLNVTIDEKQYKSIVEQLRLNTRDKLMVYFIWEFLLSTKDIRSLKINDINIIDNKANIHINDKNIIIDDLNVIEDIKKCVEEKYYYVINLENNKIKRLYFKESNFLFKTLLGVKNRKIDTPGDPNKALKAAFKKQNVKCEGIDLLELSIEDIKRSRIIYMLQNNSIENIKKIFNLGNINNHSWLKKILVLKYKESEEK